MATSTITNAVERKGEQVLDDVRITRREHEVIELIGEGLSNKEIADRLNISVESIRWHLKNIYQKLHVHSRTEAASKIRPRG